MTVEMTGLIDALRKTLIEHWPSASSRPAQFDWRALPMEPLGGRGLAHDHIRLIGTGWLARIPKQSQMRLPATENLIYQAACFTRAEASLRTPKLIGILPPSADLPRGALIVEEIVGRPATLPNDLPLLAKSLAAVHRIPVPSMNERAPLLNPSDPLSSIIEEIEWQAKHLSAANLSEFVKSRITTELADLKSLSRFAKRPTKRMIAFDAHPGNFVISCDKSMVEEAFLVDLEKCRYSYPSFDLAHATLYTSTTWDSESHAILEPTQVLQTYRIWTEATFCSTDLADPEVEDWHLPLRRAMWLWSITWCAMWRVSSARAPLNVAEGQDWSAQKIERKLADHVRDRVDHYLSDQVVRWIDDEFDYLHNALSPSRVNSASF